MNTAASVATQPTSSIGGAASGPTSTAAAAPDALTAGDSAPASPKAPELQIKCVFPSLMNFVCSANLGMRFDLTNLFTKSHKKAELVPKKNCIVMKLGGPRATAMLFANGKLVCTGAETEDAIKAAARKFTQIIQKMDYPGVNLIDFKIQNVVGTCELGFRVLVEELSFAHHDYCTYEPELYPALIYRLEKPKVKILVFVSGKVVFTSSKDPRELHAAFDAILPVLRPIVLFINSLRLLLNTRHLCCAMRQILHQFKDTKRVDAVDPFTLDAAGHADAADSAAAKQKGAGSHGRNDDDDDDQSMEDDSHLDD
ncbi:Tata-box-binding protein, partial [Globisporangium splendens]